MRVVLFTGKGGVGKTTLSAATAAHLARSGRKTLVVSTDPAHSLGDALDVALDGEPRELGHDGGLFAAHIDTRTLLDGAWGSLQGHLRALLAGIGIDEIVADELTVLPGVEDLLALSEVRRLAESGPWEVVVVDCGPTAETLRLLALPEALAGYLERLFPAHRRAVRGMLAGLSGRGAAESAARLDSAVDALDGLAEQLGGLTALLTDPARSSVRLVTTPERVVAAETRRTQTALALHDIRVDGLVVNRIVPEPSASLRGPAARWLRERHAEQSDVLADLTATAAGDDVVIRAVAYAAAEPTGVPALLALADTVYGDEDPVPPPAPARPPLTVRRTAGEGVALDSEFELSLRLPGAEDGPLDLARVGDDLVVTVGFARRPVSLPSVLRRCEVVSARLDSALVDGADGENVATLRVLFRPDPAVWMR